MAARENQGYLIGIIVLVLLSLILALAAFYGLSKMSEYSDNRAAAEQKLALEAKLSQANAIRAEILKAYIGELGPGVSEVGTQVDSLQRLATSPELSIEQKKPIEAILKNVKDDIQAKYDKDMRAHGAAGDGEAANELTYSSLVSSLSKTLAIKHDELNIKVQQANLAEQDAKTKIAAKETEVAQLKQTLETEKTAHQQDKVQAAKDQQALVAALDENKKQLESAQEIHNQVKLKAGGVEAELRNQVVQTQVQNKNLKQKVNDYEQEVFDRPDGDVIEVASDLNLIFINLGRVDGLTPNRSFAVYDQSVTDFEKGKNKATVEVIRVGETQSQARITEEDPTKPILAGDYVLTATWDPGYAVPMALAGDFDLDHDGFSDVDRLMQMIKRNGGKVVAWNDAEGKIHGEIDSSVRYLVVGDSPELGPDANMNVVRAIEKLKGQAEKNTVQVIDLQKLLNRMGVRAKAKLETVDRRSSSFQSRSPAGK